MSKFVYLTEHQGDRVAVRASSVTMVQSRAGGKARLRTDGVILDVNERTPEVMAMLGDPTHAEYAIADALDYIEAFDTSSAKRALRGALGLPEQDKPARAQECTCLSGSPMSVPHGAVVTLPNSTAGIDVASCVLHGATLRFR